MLKHADGERVFLCAPVYKDKQIVSGVKLLKLLLADGYTRLFIPNARKKKTIKSLDDLGKFLDINTKTKATALPKRDFFIVIDRFAIQSDERQRLIDSFRQAYQASVYYNKELFGGHLRLLTTDGKVSQFTEHLTCDECQFHFPQLTPQLFSFNSPVGACESCNGFGNTLVLDEKKIIPNPKLSINEGAIYPHTMPSAAKHFRDLRKYCRENKIDLDTPWDKLPKKQQKIVWNGHKKFKGVVGLFDYLETKKYKMHVRVFLSRFKGSFTCPECNGGRLKELTRHVLIKDNSMQDISKLTLKELYQWFCDIKFSEREEESIKEVYGQLKNRLEFMNEIGVHYLTLERPTRTLSGGEFQRLMLAKQLGMGLSETLYVLDEPTIGLHPRDNDRLIRQLKNLNQLGNTLVIVEHDESVIKNSQHVIEMGPGSGSLGGDIVFEGSTDQFINAPDSLTAGYLNKKEKNSTLISPRDVDMSVYKYQLSIQGCQGNNLKNINVDIPLNRIVTFTGVSGSGKSTLVTQTLYPALTQALSQDYKRGLPYKKITGTQHLSHVLYINQESMGRTERSNPLTYLKVYDAIRALFAATPLAQERGYTAGTFSLNVDGGRCPVCRGLGYEEVDMVFMDNIRIPCDSCKGKKFRKEILDVQYKGRSIYDVLRLTVKESMDFFIHHPNIRRPLAFLKEVGLDYLQIGQSTATFSGGEIQRIKIARELLNSKHKETLYILDEPTTGLHFREVHLLMDVLDKIVEMGGSVILIEHNLDVISRSDYIIDIGPEAGSEGGKIIAQGSPLDLIYKKTHTAKFLKEHMEGG